MLIERTAGGSGVEDQDVELRLPGPCQNLLHQATGEPTPAKGRFRVDVEHDPLAARDHIHPAIGSA